MTEHFDTIKLAVAAVLHAELHTHALSAAELARRSGVSAQTLHDYLTGRTEPPLSRLFALDHAFGRETGWLARRVANQVRAGEQAAVV